ncbi:hypothetical protein [Spirosoma aerolatum]|uniref:hypothetical protein n=1 Tax=Spirosoma aerolatum TaxID=1211326 RepID=UPI0012D35C99|nr:hypothetical protein [Spirosoma aerolatum]
MSKLRHQLAHREAHAFLEILWDELPVQYMGDVERIQYDLEVWLIAFYLLQQQEQMRGFELLAYVRRAAETYYQENFRQVHHTRILWAFFRFRLELALLKTITADQQTLDHCYAYHDVLAGLSYRISLLKEGPGWDYNSPSRNTPF